MRRRREPSPFPCDIIQEAPKGHVTCYGFGSRHFISILAKTLSSRKQVRYKYDTNSNTNDF